MGALVPVLKNHHSWPTVTKLDRPDGNVIFSIMTSAFEYAVNAVTDAVDSITTILSFFATLVGFAL